MALLADSSVSHFEINIFNIIIFGDENAYNYPYCRLHGVIICCIILSAYKTRTDAE